MALPHNLDICHSNLVKDNISVAMTHFENVQRAYSCSQIIREHNAQHWTDWRPNSRAADHVQPGQVLLELRGANSYVTEQQQRNYIKTTVARDEKPNS